MSLNYFQTVLDAVAASGADGVPSGILVCDLLTTYVPKVLWDCIWIRMRGRVADFVYCEEGSVEHATLKDPNNPKKKLEYYPVIPFDSPRLQSWSAAMDVRVKPSEELYDGYLGIYGKKLQRFKISDTQRQTIMLLKHAGELGMAQNEMANILGKGGNNFGYVVTSLEERGKVFKERANVKVNGNVVSTSFVWLSCYKSIVEAKLMNSNKMSFLNRNGQQVDVEVQQDEDIIRRVLEYLVRQKNDDTAIEKTVKTELGFEKTEGHRSWRRIRTKMSDMGLIEQFDGVLENGSKESFIKKKNDYVADLEPETTPIVVRTPPRFPGQELAELTLDRQILVKIAKDSKNDRIFSSQLAIDLGFSLKKHSVRLDVLEHRFKEAPDYEFLAVVVNRDKSSQKSYRVCNTTSEMILNANKAILPTLYERNATKGTDAENPAANAEHQPLVEVPVYYTSENRAYPEIFSRRLSWLVDAVKTHGFILGLEAGAYILEQEKIYKSRSGEDIPKDIDHKTVSRIAAMAEKEKMIKSFEAQIPSKTGVSDNRNVLVYIQYDSNVTDDTISRIMAKYYNSFQNRLQKKGNTENRDEIVVTGEFRKAKGNKGQAFDVFNMQKENGYLESKLSRCQVIAEALLRMIESRADGYVPEHFESLLEAVHTSGSGTIRCIQEIPEQKVFSMGAMKSKMQEISVFEPTDANKRLVFTRDELWNALTVHDFILALGSLCKDRNFLTINKSRHLSELSQEELMRLTGSPDSSLTAPERHLREIVLELTKLGVAKPIVPGSLGSIQGESGVYYMLSNQVMCEQEMPLNMSEELSENGGPRRSVMSFSLLDAEERRGYWIQLQYLFANLPKSKHNNEPSDGAQRKSCFPADRVSNKNFGKGGSSAEDLEKVKLRIENENISKNEIASGWRNIDALATKWNIPVEAIIRGFAEVNSQSKKASKKLGRRGDKKPSGTRATKKRSRSASGVDANTNEAEEDEAEEPTTILHPEERPQARGRKWSEKEDRELLFGWVGCLVSHGINSKGQWKKVAAASGISDGRCRSRILRLEKVADLNVHMNAIKKESEKVYQSKHGSENAGKKPAKQMYGVANLFEVQSDEDLQSMQKILTDIEKVVAGAPERSSDGNNAASARHERLAKSQPDGSSPSDFLAWLHSYLLKSKSMAGSLTVPSIEVMGAMSALLAILYELEYMGKSIDMAQKVLSERFTEETLRLALKTLMRNGLITAENAGDKPIWKFHLSSQYKSEISPPFSPLMLLEDMNVSQHLRDGCVWPLPQQKPISVTPSLAEAVMGNGIFSAEVPKDVLHAFESLKSNESASGRLGQHCLDRNMARIKFPEMSRTHEATNAEVEKQSSVLYQPNAVLDSSDDYKKAQSAFLEESTRIFGANVGKSILETISKAGPNGVAMSSLRSLLHHNNLNVDTVSIENLLRKFGLVRIINGYDEKYIVSSLCSSHLVILKKDKSEEVGEESVQKTGREPLKEVPLAPWISSEGDVLPQIWYSLLHKVLDIVGRFPGINGELLIKSSLRVVPPQLAREIIQALWKEGVLYYQENPSQSTPLEMKNGIFTEGYTYANKQKADTTVMWSANDKKPPFHAGQAKDFFFSVNPEKLHHALKIQPLSDSSLNV